jgi:PHD/YefM family antitoxin component YafN of YafNO toxin-antitoxin module
MNVQYLVDQKGHKTGVFLSLEEFEHLMDLLEEAQDIKDFRAAKAEDDEWVALKEAKQELGL